MTTSVKTRNTGSAGKGIGSGVPECSAAEREPIAGEPETVGDRCPTCHGHGLVRAVGKNAGKHYRTTSGAQQAMDAGRARDCAACEGTGVETVAPF